MKNVLTLLMGPQAHAKTFFNNKGNTLISSLISMGIASITMFAIIQITVDSKKVTAQMDRSDNASESLVRVMLNLYSADFYDLVAYCSEKRALNRVYTGSCLRNGRITTVASTLPKDIFFELEQPLDENGPTASSTPLMCAELRSCNILAGGQMLELVVSQHWKIPGDRNTIFQKQANIRKTRW